MIRYQFLVIIAITLSMQITACKRDRGLFLYVQFDSVRNLKEGSEVFFKNVSVGNVTELKLIKGYKILAKINLNNAEVHPNVGDTFALVRHDYFGTQIIQIIQDKSHTQRHANGDTIVGVILNRKPLVELDSGTRKVVRDSLLVPFIRN